MPDFFLTHGAKAPPRPPERSGKNGRRAKRANQAQAKPANRKQDAQKQATGGQGSAAQRRARNRTRDPERRTARAPKDERHTPKAAEPDICNSIVIYFVFLATFP